MKHATEDGEKAQKSTLANFTKDMQGDIADYQRKKQVEFDLMRKAIIHAEALQKKEADDLMNNNPPSDDLQYKISQEFIKVHEGAGERWETTSC